MQNKTAQEGLGKITSELGSDKPVDAAILGAIIKMLAEGSYDTYKRNVAVDYAGSEAKTMLVDAARGLAGQLVGVRLEPSGNGQVVVEKTVVKLPDTWLDVVQQDPDRIAARRELWRARMWEFIDYCQRLRGWLEARRLGYRQQYRRKARRDGGQADLDLWNTLQGRWAADWRNARRRALEQIAVIVDQVGEDWDVGDNAKSLEMSFNIALRGLADPRYSYEVPPQFQRPPS